MKHALILASLVLAMPVHADPHPCAVHVARAPAAIRAEIERWLAGESSCNVALEVRVVPTEGGYYLLARDVRGRVRERIVPDGASAGVLVASWASDDQLGADEPAPNVPRPAGIDGDDDDDTSKGSDDARAAAPAPPSSVVPSPAIVARAVVAPVAPDMPPPSKWLRIDVLDPIAGVAGSGLRAEVDVWQRHGWSVGLGASMAQGSQSLDTLEDGMDPVTMRDLDAVAYIARTANVLPWLHLRGALAAGARITTAMVPYIYDYNDQPSGPFTRTNVRATADASLLAGAELGHGWALEVGVLLSAVTGMTDDLETPSGSYVLELDPALGVQFFGGLAHRL
ncbi:MAG TPA: hypothetical protein VGL61_23915 [Kofleriaceae bacterium]|jgi:hypothetical protein